VRPQARSRYHIYLHENPFFLNIEIEIGIGIGIEIEIAFHASFAQACLRFGRHMG
jgi:hypothetical protein